MEAAKQAKDAPRAEAGELVVQNGRQAGARRPLGTPTTFVGRGSDCDIRLNVDGVDPLHCVLVFGSTGIQVRDLNSIHGTYVNGERIEQVLLQQGDLLKVGPFQFRLKLAAGSATSEPLDNAADDLRASVRIQAAAIAAQQVALEEDESRLQKRRSDMQQQEEQLAAHLAEKQRQVQLWSEYTKAERETLRKEKIEHEKKMAAIETELHQGKEELAKNHQKLTQERQHIAKVYQRLRQRWQKQWSGEKEKHQKQTADLEVACKNVEQKQEALRARDTALAQEILRFNAERELSARQLQEGRAALRQDQDRWRSRRSHELAVLNARRQDLDESQGKITQLRQLLNQERESWSRQQDVLQKELHGLNNRIVHQRMKIQEQEEKLARVDAVVRDRQAASGTDTEDTALECEVEILPGEPTEAVATVVPAEEIIRCDDLDRLAGELADQRALLIEQYLRMVEIQETWQQQRDRAVVELEALAQGLVADEQTLANRQQQTMLVEGVLRERQAEIETVRQEIHVWRAQLKAREQAFEQDQELEIRALRQKSQLLDEQLVGIAQLRQRWSRRRQEETDRLLADRQMLEREQKETHDERVELFAKAQQIAEEKRVLTEKALAMEVYRQEVFLRAKDPSAQRRVDRLRRRWLNLNAALIGNAKAERESTNQELARLEISRTQLNRQHQDLTQADAMFHEKQTILDEREAVLKARQLHLEQDLRQLESQRQRPEEEYLRMKDQVETMAKAVYDEGDAPPIDRAA